MKVPCSKCGKLFDIPVIVSIMNLCKACRDEDMAKQFDLPKGYEALFGGFKK